MSSMRSTLLRRSSGGICVCSRTAKLGSPTVIESRGRALLEQEADPPSDRAKLHFRNSVDPVLIEPDLSRVGCRSPTRCFRSTLLPHPLGPMTTVVAPDGKSRFSPSSTWLRPKDFCSCSTLIKGMSGQQPQRSWMGTWIAWLCRCHGNTYHPSIQWDGQSRWVVFFEEFPIESRFMVT